MLSTQRFAVVSIPGGQLDLYIEDATGIDHLETLGTLDLRALHVRDRATALLTKADYEFVGDWLLTAAGFCAPVQRQPH